MHTTLIDIHCIAYVLANCMHVHVGGGGSVYNESVHIHAASMLDYIYTPKTLKYFCHQFFSIRHIIIVMNVINLEGEFS